MSQNKNEIATLRTKKGYNQEQFADKIGITRQYLWQIETNRHIPSLELMVLMADVLGVSILRVVKIFTPKK